MMKSMRSYLPPPQQYELAEMLKHKNIDDLLKVAEKKSKKGVEQYLPVSSSNFTNNQFFTCIFYFYFFL